MSLLVLGVLAEHHYHHERKSTCSRIDTADARASELGRYRRYFGNVYRYTINLFRKTRIAIYSVGLNNM